ncbi:MAG: hypothetical protein AAFS10_04655 [Myxococcota bacterium]
MHTMGDGSVYRRSGAQRVGWAVLMWVSFSCLTGFAPFDTSGLSQFNIVYGRGTPEASELDNGLGVSSVETEAIFHTLSSRYGGGGVLIYMEFFPRSTDFSGMLLLDLRHGGLPDLDSTTLDMPDARRAELYYQEWDKGGDLFVGTTASGDITVRDLYRGQSISAIAITWDLVFTNVGADGQKGTSDDAWRRLTGSAITEVSVENALRRDSGAFHRQRGNSDGTVEVYAPDGDIQVDCFGGVYVEDETYQEESYSYEDDSSSCQGDTWEDDSEDPQAGSGCDGGDTVDDGKPDPQGGCDDGIGDDIDDPGSEEDEGSFYGGDYDSGDSSGSSCDSDTDSSDSSGSGCDDDDTDTGGSSSSESSDDDSSCEGDEEATAATRWEREPQPTLRQRLDRLEVTTGQMVHPAPSSDAPRVVRQRKRRGHTSVRSQLIGVVRRYASFLLLVVVIRLWRRRMEYA